MRFDDLEGAHRGIAYKLLAATIVPRPIAWVVTLNPGGGVNAAPYSFFNAMGDAPPTIALGITADSLRPGNLGGAKDSGANIRATGEFTVNLVPESLVRAMNVTAVDAPQGVDELALAGVATAPSAHVAPPRIADSPVSFECVTHTLVETGPSQFVVIGRVLSVHIADRFVRDAARGHIDTPALDLVARSFGSDYVRSHDTFQLDRPKWTHGTGG